MTTTEQTPDHVVAIYTNPVHCSEHTTSHGDIIQLGHYYRRFDGIWICVVCRQARPDGAA